MRHNTAIRRFSIQLGGEAIRVGRALGYELEKIGKLQPDRLVLAADGNADALAEIEELMMTRNKGNPRARIQRPSMAQDMHKGRRTEIQFMNGFIAEKGKAARHPDAGAREAHRGRDARGARRDSAVAREPGRLTHFRHSGLRRNDDLKDSIAR